MNVTEVKGSRNDVLYQNLELFLKETKNHKIVNRLFENIIGDYLSKFSIKYDSCDCDLYIKLKEEHSIKLMDQDESIPTKLLINIWIRDDKRMIGIYFGKRGKEGQAPYNLSEHHNERNQWEQMMIESEKKTTQGSLTKLQYSDLSALPFTSTCKPLMPTKFHVCKGELVVGESPSLFLSY